MSNLSLTEQLIHSLIQFGVREWVVCAGSHNAPIVSELQKNKKIKVHYHFDERGAAFYALGISRRLTSPVVVVTTSGTAVAECLPAVIEAFYSGDKLIILSADREEKFIGTGAPQVINQNKVLSSHSKYLEITNLTKKITFPTTLPVHINIRFSEPLFDNDKKSKLKISFEKKDRVKKKIITIDSFIKDKKSPLVIIEQTNSLTKNELEKLIISLGAPVLAHPRSGLLYSQKIKKFIIKYSDDVLKKYPPDSVIRIGEVPCTSFWRDLERDPKLKKIPIYNFAERGLSGLARTNKLFNLELYTPQCKNTFNFTEYLNKAKKFGEYLHSCHKFLCKKHPQAELSLLQSIEKLIKYDLLYLGNSLPIRDWEKLLSDSKVYKDVFGNRGANGIDGQIATFAGIMNGKSVGVFGDLTSLYDLPSFTLLKEKFDYKIVIINNNGGKIFKRLPYFSSKFPGKTGEEFTNRHSHSFYKLLSGFGYKVKEIRDTLKKIPSENILEVLPSEIQTVKFENEFKNAVSEYVEIN